MDAEKSCVFPPKGTQGARLNGGREGDLHPRAPR